MNVQLNGESLRGNILHGRTQLRYFYRLQTRTQFVKLKEVDLASRKQNCRFEVGMMYLLTVADNHVPDEQVVLAFQNAMLLLSQAQN